MRKILFAVFVLLFGANCFAYGSYTKLLLPCDGVDGSVTIIDKTGKTITAFGNAQLDTAQKVFGTASILFDGTEDYLSTPTHADWDLAGGDFTLECRVRFNALTAGTYPELIGVSRSGAGNRGWQFYYAVNEQEIIFEYSTDGTNQNWFARAWTPSLSTWYHIIVIRNDANLKFFVDGTQLGSAQGTGAAIIYNNSKPLSLGANLNPSDVPTSTSYLDGWLDEVRISKGIARWTGNFTVPKTPYTSHSFIVVD